MPMLVVVNSSWSSIRKGSAKLSTILRATRDVVHVRDVGEDHGELVAAEAGDDVRPGARTSAGARPRP